MYAQSLLNPTTPLSTDDALNENQQENDLRRLMKRFSHVDESVIYNTYFEISEGNYTEAEKLIER